MDASPSGPSRVRRRTRRGLTIVGGIALGLIAFEIALQMVALLIWSRTASAPAVQSSADRRAVLCIGDSFTFGLGASDAEHAYPAVLATQLEREQPGRWSVVNRGVPGNTSGRILARLRPLVAALRPAFVCILAGCNDRLNLDDEVFDSEPANTVDDFAWRIRTFEFLERVVIAIRGGPAPASQAPKIDDLLGIWHTGEIEVLFEPDGRVVFAGVPSTWRVTDGELRIGAPETQTAPIRWRLDGSRLILDGTSLPGGSLRLEPGVAARDPLSLARVALAEGRLDDARTRLAECPDEVATRGLRVQVEARAGRAELVERGLRSLREDPAAGDELARVLLSIGRVDEGLALAHDRLTERPRNFDLWMEVSRVGERSTGHARTVLTIIDSTLPKLRGESRWEPILLIARGSLQNRIGGAPAEVLTDLLQAGFLQGTFQPAIGILRSNRTRFDDSAVDLACDRLQLSADQRAVVADLVTTARATIDAPADRLERHIERCAAICLEYGATLVLLTYPEPMDLDAAVRRSAKRLEVPVIDLQPSFADALRSGSRDDWFITDGHCNDAGYARMAQVIAPWFVAQAGHEPRGR